MKKRLLSAVIALCMTMAWLPAAAFAEEAGKFPDVPDTAGYAQAVELLAHVGVFSGDENGNFNPNNVLTRAQAASVICRALGEEAAGVTADPFDDVDASYWAAGVIVKAVDLHIVSGYGNGKFGPDDPVTYAQFLTMLLRAFALNDYADSLGGYPDGYLAAAEQYGVTEGITGMTADSNTTRSVAAMALYNMMFQ